MLFDLEQDKLQKNFKYDILIIGAGAAGIVCANRINKINPLVKIAVVESGGLDNDETINTLDTNFSKEDKINFKKSIARYLGGKTNLWSGRIVDIDNNELSKWPLKKEEIQKWKNHAIKYLTKNYSLNKLLEDANSLARNDIFSQVLGDSFNISPSLFIKLKRFKLNYKKNNNVDLFIKGTAVKFNSLNTKIKNLEVISSISGEQHFFNSNFYICCNGGLEVVKLLLHSGIDKKIGLANSSKKLGLNFSAHPRGVEGIIELRKKLNTQKSFFCSTKKVNDDIKIEFGIELSDFKVIENKISKSRICFDPIFKEFHSKFFYLLNKNSEIKRKLFNKLEIKEKGFLLGMLLFIKIKLKKLFKKPIYTKYFLLRNYCASSLNTKSKVYLTKNKDMHGYEKLSIDWKISENDKNSLILTHEYLSEILKTKNIGSLKSNINKKKWEIWNGSSHFMSTTVMSKSKKDGVVDTNCRSHDIDNLFICGPSIFPTPSNSNPMLFIVLFSLRLADYLADLLKS